MAEQKRLNLMVCAGTGCVSAGSLEIKEVIEAHPKIGEILDNYEIGCIKCSIGTCLLKDVVAVHVLGDDIEAMMAGK